jgi:hypothetical protein
MPTFEQRANQLRANTVNPDTVNVSSSDIYNELLLQNAETPDATAATAANQEIQIANENTQIANQQTIIDDLTTVIENQQTIIAAQNSQIIQFAASTNNGLLTDEFYTQALTAVLVALPVRNAKTVTLINLSTNNSVLYKTNTTAAVLTLEAGYSVKINTNSANNISVRQLADAGQSIQIIVTA